jgi:shikimate dehydrogenase
MEKIHLALIGKNIQHSKSKEVYENLLQKEICYDLIDLEKIQDLPDLNILKKQFDGVSITTPYKDSYLSASNLQIDPISQNLNAINCIGFWENQIKATNTDYLGIKQIILDDFISLNRNLVILGNGVMARIIKHIARELALSFDQFCRNTHGDLTHLDIAKFLPQSSNLLIINCCSRDFHFQGNLPSDCYFWDLNYNLQYHQDTLPNKCDRYIDGTSLLVAQARQALLFWNIK